MPFPSCPCKNLLINCILVVLSSFINSRPTHLPFTFSSSLTSFPHSPFLPLTCLFLTLIPFKLLFIYLFINASVGENQERWSQLVSIYCCRRIDGGLGRRDGRDVAAGWDGGFCMIGEVTINLNLIMWNQSYELKISILLEKKMRRRRRREGIMEWTLWWSCN